MARSYNYYDFREAKVHIYYALKAKGWETFSFKADESDSMTDYYSPAYWSPAIAVKNGFILCIDISDYDVKGYSGKEEYTYNYDNTNFTTNDKIQKLQALANDSAATDGEKAAALNMIEKLQNKIEDNKDAKEKSKQLLYKYPEFMANPGKCKWHIEKDGKIIDKGTGIGKFSDIPHFWDVVTNDIAGSRFWMGGEEKKPNETEQKAIDAFNTFITRVDNIGNGCVVMGDGTEETELAAQEAETNKGYEKVIIKKVKNVIKPVEVTDRKEIKLGDILSFSYHGHYWKVYNESEKNFSYTLLGSARRGYMDLKPQQGNHYYQSKARLQKDMSEGKIKIYELKEVEEVTEEEKWVKIKPTKANNTTKKAEQKETVKTTSEQPENQEQAQTTNNSQAPATFKQLRALYFITKINTKNANISKQQASDLIGRANKGENIKEELKDILNGEQVKQQATEQTETKQEGTVPETNNTTQAEDPYKQPEIEEGYLYNAHFKAWNYSIEAIQAIVSEYNIPFVNMGEKIGVYNLTAEQARQVKTISDANGSIFFIDNKQEITEQPEQFEPTTEQETQEEETKDMFEDILGKFDNIEVNNTARITAQDQAFCEEHQQQYNDAIKMLMQCLQIFKELSGIDLLDKANRYNKSKNKYLDWYKFEAIADLAKEAKGNFINNICWYFQKQYSITIDSKPIIDKYNFDVTYDNIIDEIFVQLDGFSFAEKATKEIKENIHKLVYNQYHNEWNLDIKQNTISLKTYLHWGTTWDGKEVETGYSADKITKPIFEALSHYETRQAGLHHSFKEFTNYTLRGTTDYWFTLFEIDCQKITGVRFYKNGRIDIKFSSNQHAQQFAKEYCGYTKAA